MNKGLKKVRDFHWLFNHPVEITIGLEPEANRRLRVLLLAEELFELANASGCIGTLLDFCEKQKRIASDEDTKYQNEYNPLEELDALCDLQYVLNGKILSSGFHMIFDKAFKKVHHNNMNKLFDTFPAALESGAANVRTVNYKGQIRYVAYNVSGKVIKPNNHTKVNLNQFVPNEFRESTGKD